MKVLLSYFFMQNLKYYQCSYRLYNNVQRFSESTDVEKIQEDIHLMSNAKNQCLQC